MKYFIKKKLQVEGPYSKNELLEMLGSLKIGIKTLCKSETDEVYKPLNKVIPELALEIKQKRNSRLASQKSVKSTKDLSHILVTTETLLLDFHIEKRLDIISSESALGMNIFKDIFTNIRDIVGGESISTQKILRELKENALLELRKQADRIGANAIIGVKLDYNEFTGAGRSMLFLVISGTAVLINKRANKPL